MKATIVAVVAALGLLVASAAPAAVRAGAGPGAHAAAACPRAWVAGWQKLANRVAAPVYCPTWMPNPLDARIGGQWQDIYSIDPDHSYLVSFLYHGDGPSGDVHVNFRGYPGETKIPTCKTIVLAGTKTIRGTTPCFADPHGFVRVHGQKATVYTVNQDADQWHILLAWRYDGSLYTVSEHVIKPYTMTQVVRNLHVLAQSLVLVRPKG